MTQACRPPDSAAPAQPVIGRSSALSVLAGTCRAVRNASRRGSRAASNAAWTGARPPSRARSAAPARGGPRVARASPSRAEEPAATALHHDQRRQRRSPTDRSPGGAEPRARADPTGTRPRTREPRMRAPTASAATSPSFALDPNVDPCAALRSCRSIDPRSQPSGAVAARSFVPYAGGRDSRKMRAP